MTTSTSNRSQTYIVLATWNGQAYVAEQIESIRQQTESNWTLLIRDDGSDDTTLSIVADYCRQDSRIELLTDALGRLGPNGNFARLMQTALDRGADYVFVADQDDVWHSEKLSEQLKLMSRTEQETGGLVPTLVYTDLAVANDQLEVVRPSFNEFTKPPVAGHAFLTALLERNYVPGCSILANRRLLQLSLPFPDVGVMYDHWLTLCAAASGHICCVPQPMLKYRRHGGTVTPTATPPAFVIRLYRVACGVLGHNDAAKDRLNGRIKAVRMLLDRTCSSPENHGPATLEEYCRAFEPDVSVIKRISGLRRLGLPRNRGPVGQILYYVTACRVDGVLRKAA